MKNITTPSDIGKAVASGQLIESHTSLARGYVSRKGPGSVAPYKGRFGSGYVHLAPCWKSSRYYFRSYYLFAQ